MTEEELTFPLVPRGRLVGLSFGSMRSLRRGRGSDVTGSRPYVPGDDVEAIDWGASARLSTARAADEFVVRERLAEEAPRVVIACDCRPQMVGFPSPLPWLDKRLALRRAAQLVADSAGRAGGFVGYVEQADGSTFWQPPLGERLLAGAREERLSRSRWAAPPDWLDRTLALLLQHRRAVTAGSFVFLLSDFLPPRGEEAWLPLLERGIDLVPVVIQDPTWEQSFPDVAGLVLPLRDPATGRRRSVLLSRREVAERRRANEERLAHLLGGFRELGLEPVLVSSSERADILASFLAWAEARRRARVPGR